MTPKEFLSLRKGRYYPFRITTYPKVKKAFRDIGLTKVTYTVARVGIQYKNLLQTREQFLGDKASDKNLTPETDGLPWGKYATDEYGDGAYPFIIENKGFLYGRLYMNMGQTKTYYFDKQGRTVDKQSATDMQYAKKPREAHRGILTNTPHLSGIELIAR